MSNLIPFSFQQHPIRIIQKQGEPWFIAKDVAAALGYADTDYAIRAHCKAAETCPDDSSGQVRHVKVIPERDVYRLIMKSQLPSAEKFEDWVVSEVLPSIRKSGQYNNSINTLQLPDFNNPAAAARAWADEYDQKIAALEKLNVADQEIQRLQGVCQTIAAQFSPGMTPAEFCRQLNGVNTQLVQGKLASKGILIKEHYGYRAASYYRDNWFAEKKDQYDRPGGAKGVKTTVILTKKGAVAIYKLYLKSELPMKTNWDGKHTHCIFDHNDGGASS